MITEETQVLTNNNIFTVNPNQQELIVFNPNTNNQPGQLVVSNNFTQALNEMKNIVTQAKQLLSTNINELDEEDYKQLKDRLKPVQAYKKQFDDTRKKMKKYFKETTDSIIAQYDLVLKQAGFDQLEEVDRKRKQLDKDIRANRANKRWHKLETYFEAQLTQCPTVLTMSKDKLGSFDYFRTKHNNLISGAKSKHLTDDIIAQMNNEVYGYEQALKKLANTNLKDPYKKIVLDNYLENPTLDNMVLLIEQQLEQQNKDDEKFNQENIISQGLNLAYGTLITPQIQEYLQQQLPNVEQNMIDKTIDQVIYELTNNINYQEFTNEQHVLNEAALKTYILNKGQTTITEIINRLTMDYTNTALNVATNVLINDPSYLNMLVKHTNNQKELLQKVVTSLIKTEIPKQNLNNYANNQGFDEALFTKNLQSQSIKWANQIIQQYKKVDSPYRWILDYAQSINLDITKPTGKMVIIFDLTKNGLGNSLPLPYKDKLKSATDVMNLIKFITEC